MPEELESNVGVASNIETTELVEKKLGFLYEITNSNSTVGDLKALVNSIIKSIEKEEDIFVTFTLDIVDHFNVSKPKSMVAEMKSLISTMLKMVEKDEAAAGEISFKLRIESK